MRKQSFNPEYVIRGQRFRIQDNFIIRRGTELICHENVLYNKNIALATHLLTLPNYNPFTQTAASHSLPNIPPFYPSPVVPRICIRSRCCCVYLVNVCPDGRWKKDCRYRVVLLRGILNLSIRFIYQLPNSGLNLSLIHISEPTRRS